MFKSSLNGYRDQFPVISVPKMRKQINLLASFAFATCYLQSAVIKYVEANHVLWLKLYLSDKLLRYFVLKRLTAYCLC